MNDERTSEATANAVASSAQVTAEDVEARRYVYCSVTFHEPLAWAKLLVPKMPAKDARTMARAVAEERVGKPATQVHIYGANYIRQSRALVALGGFTYSQNLSQLR